MERTEMRYLFTFLMLLLPVAAKAQPYQVVTSCGSVSNSGAVGAGMNGYIDISGNICVAASSSSGSVTAAGVNGTTAQAVQGITGGVPVPTTPGILTLVPLDIATVTTGGTAVTALTAGHRNKGGWLYNPSTATVNLCINEQGTASGTTSAGSTTCIPPDRTYNLVPSGNAVSVISSDSAHPFSGMGLN